MRLVSLQGWPAHYSKPCFTANGSHYTCTEYRAEMILLGLMRRLQDEALDSRQKEELLRQIKTIEAEMGME